MSRGLQTVNHSNQVALWSERIAACRSSGQTVSQWCKAEGISLSTYYGWQRKLLEQLTAQETVCFAEISVPQTPSSNVVATLRAGEIRIELSNRADSTLIHNLVEALKSC